MKKSILLLLIGICGQISFANPIVEPPILTEIYFGNGNLQIELYFQDFYNGWYDNLDDLNLCSSQQTVEFNDGIAISIEEEMILGESDLKSSFNFNPEGDVIWIEDNWGWVPGYFEYYFGNHPYSDVPVPAQNQSIAAEGYFDYQMGYTYISCIGLEQPPTLGSYAFHINTFGDMEGWIYDLNSEPIQGLKVLNNFTDEDGYFFVDDLFCNIKNNLKIYHNDNVIYNFNDTIYPNQTSQHIFYLDTLFTGIPEYFNHPNPLYGKTSFTINIPPQNQFTTGYLAIYDMTGKQVDRINIDRRQQEITWSSARHDPGIYIYNLVLDGKKFGSKKMIIQ